jgi:DNA-binding NtrC family response regulator
VGNAAMKKAHLGRVLVVDDDPAMRRVCARVLGNEGWEVVVVEGGKAAIASVCEQTVPFDCVVSDVHMPEIDGFALIAAIRRYDDELPVLLMTGDPSLDGAVRAIDTGAVSYLSKPFDHETLAAGVARARPRTAS